MNCICCEKEISKWAGQLFVYYLGIGYEYYDDIVPDDFPDRLEIDTVLELSQNYCTPQCYVKDINLKITEKEEKENRDRLNEVLFSDVNGYVYFMKSKINNWLKIGVSKNPATRQNRIQTKLPFEIDIVKQIASSNPYKLENNLHILYEDKRMNGEWFDLTDEEIEEICEFNPSKIVDKLIKNIMGRLRM